MNILKNIKEIISLILIVSTLFVGMWTIVTKVFITRVEAETKINKLDLDVSYNKIFRIEAAIQRLDRIRQRRDLSKDEEKIYKRYIKMMDKLDRHIDELEKKND